MLLNCLPFDCHNHIHMGPNDPSQALIVGSASKDPRALCGMALMCTHPRDYDRIDILMRRLPQDFPSVHIVPSFGVHPWFLHELPIGAWEKNVDEDKPQWILDLTERLKTTPCAIVAEIGLDGFHFDPITRNLVSPIEKQVEAFRLQLELAHELGRCVSVHSVQCTGPLMETLSLMKRRKTFPSKFYFHAFGGKAGTVDQLIALCKPQPVYFGFAPSVNFRSHKTAELVRKVGIDKLLLETDHEDAALVPGSMQDGITFIANALNVSPEDVVRQTTMNALEFYGLNAMSPRR